MRGANRETIGLAVRSLRNRLRRREQRSPYLALRRRRHAAKPSIALPTNARLAGSGAGVRLPLTKPEVVSLLVLASE